VGVRANLAVTTAQATGAGNDTVDYSGAASGEAVDLTAGTATGGAGSDTLAAIENVTGTAFDDVITGTSGVNILAGGTGNDLLDGGAAVGTDYLYGGDGIDTLSYASSAVGVRANLAVTTAQATGAGNDTLSGFEAITGSAHNDILTGDAAANLLSGGAGDDLLSGGLGDDGFVGGDGIDTVSYATAAAGVTVNLIQGNATGGAGSDTMVGIEGLIGSSHADTLIGDAGANSLSGGAGNDLLIGGVGDDVIDGGAGIDTLSYADAGGGIMATLASGSIQDTGPAGLDTVRNVENVVGSAFNDVLTGDQARNVLEGGAGDDVLDGGLGNDMLYGGDGVDTASYASATGAVRASLALATVQSTLSAGSDTLAGIENLTGGAYDDQLTGDAGNNVLTGNDGNDTLVGGGGIDTLTGGAGTDRFAYAALGDSTLAATDRITDFASGDVLDLSRIDANGTLAGNQAFHLVGAFTNGAGEFTVTFNAGADTTTALFDIDGDASADMAILFTGDVTALTGSWVL